MSFYVTVTPTIQYVEVEVNPQTLPFEVEVIVDADLKQYADDAKASADQAEASAISADNSADSALASATSATASANSASSSASSASSSASTATTQAGIATTKANEASQSASNALASEQASAISEANALQSEQNALASEQSALASANTATSQAGIATTKAGEASASASSALASQNSATASASTATTQAGIATTQASNALASANAAAASAASAAQVGTSTLLTGFSVGSNTAIAGTDTILQAFNKTQGQINARVSSNIYSANGTLAGARTLTLGGFSLDFIGTVTSRFFANGNIGIGTTTDAGFRLDVNGTTRLNGLQTFQGTTASDTAPLGSELATTGSGTNWTGTGFATGYTHTVGSTASLTTSIPAVNGTYYQITYTITGRTAGSITINYGGTSTASITATGATGPLATSTANLEIVPTTDFDGTVVLSVRSIGTSSATTTINDSGGNARIQIRATSSLSNTLIGNSAGRRITTGITNSIFGSDAGANITTGIQNCFFGSSAGFSQTTGILNSFFGTFAGQNTTIGSNNSFFGRSSGISNTTGGSNSFFGLSAGFNNTTAGNNSFFGVNSGFNNTTGSNNSFFGRDSGRLIANGSSLTIANNSVFLGFETRANADSETNQTVIGYQAIGLGSNTTVIGNSSTTFGRWWGNLLLGTSTNSGFLLDVNGTARVTGNLTTNLTAGSIPFIGASGLLTQNNSNLFWDSANGRLGINTNNPTNTLQVHTGANGVVLFRHESGVGGVRITGTGIQSNAFLYFANNFNTSITDRWSISLNGPVNALVFTDTAERMRIASGGNVLINTTTDAGFRLDVNGTARVTGNLTTNLTATRIPFIGTGGVLSDDAGLTWDNTNKRLLISQTNLGGQTTNLNLINLSTTSSTAVALKFTPSPDVNTQIGAAIKVIRTNSPSNGDCQMIFSVYSSISTLLNDYWRILSSGVLESIGAQTIQTSTGNLTVSTGGGNGNIALLPNGTGGVGVGTSSPNAVAQLEVSSTTKGFLPPRMTTAQRDLIAAVAGLVIYNTTTNKHQGHNGTAWQDFY